MIHTLRGRSRRQELPKCPWQIQEEVELYARESGRTAKVFFAPSGGWVARFSLKPNDERMVLFQQGVAEEPPTEDVWFHRSKRGGKPGEFEPLDIRDMGASGVRTFLERGNMWSGRGEVASLEEQVRTVRDANKEGAEKHRATQKEENRKEQLEKRRHWLGIPFLRVGKDLKNETRKENQAP